MFLNVKKNKSFLRLYSLLLLHVHIVYTLYETARADNTHRNFRYYTIENKIRLSFESFFFFYLWEFDEYTPPATRIERNRRGNNIDSRNNS